MLSETMFVPKVALRSWLQFVQKLRAEATPSALPNVDQVVCIDDDDDAGESNAVVLFEAMPAVSL